MNMYQVPNPGLPGCPPGLEYLTQVDQLLIKQKVEFIEALAGFESNNKYELEVQAPPGNTVGYVVQQWHPFSPKFIIENEHREAVLRLHGPFCGWSCLPDVDFEIVTMDEVDKIGKISKQWTGLLREAFTDADNFGIQFPMDLDVKMKAVMIGACFLIDFMFFESGNQP
ncbi:phospholipid scramblase 1 isoform X3 [Salvelinus alpinus]|uniref:phospholipid scramblase 1 isoform X3 n=1 Tax=Salvelinus alpinus TaxID=8036 RepID=UPI0039FCA5CC